MGPRTRWSHSFVDEPTKNRLLAEYDKRIATFVGQFQKKGGWGSLKAGRPVTYSFICNHYSVCISGNVGPASK